MTKTSISHQRVSAKYVPQRTCVGCKKVKSKRELIRLVRVSDGSVEMDASGKRAGRGAYLCGVKECWRIALKDNRLEHVLRTTLGRDNREQLIRYGEELQQGVN